MLQHVSDHIPLAVTTETLQEFRLLYVLHSDNGEDVGVQDAVRTTHRFPGYSLNEILPGFKLCIAGSQS